MVDVWEPSALVHFFLSGIVRRILLNHLDDVDVKGDFGGDSAYVDDCFVSTGSSEGNRSFESRHHETLLRLEFLTVRKGFIEVGDHFDCLKRGIIGFKNRCRRSGYVL